MTIISGLIITHVDRRVKRGQSRKEILLNEKRKGRKKKKIKNRIALHLHVIKMFPRFFNKSHRVHMVLCRHRS